MATTPSPLFQATAMPDRDWWQALWPDPAAVLEQVGVAPGMRVVDLCSGDGYFTVPFSSLVGTGAVLAIELDEAMLAAAKAAAEEAGQANITFIQGDAMKLGALIDGAVDMVLNRQHVPRRSRPYRPRRRRPAHARARRHVRGHQLVAEAA